MKQVDVRGIGFGPRRLRSVLSGQLPERESQVAGITDAEGAGKISLVAEIADSGWFLLVVSREPGGAGRELEEAALDDAEWTGDGELGANLGEVDDVLLLLRSTCGTGSVRLAVLLEVEAVICRLALSKAA